MIKITRDFLSSQIHLDAVRMGKDLNVSIYGGPTPHIGAVALGICRPSLKDPGLSSSSVSLLTVTGHKEDEIARRIADRLASTLKANVCVCAGIHFDDLKYSEIQAMEKVIFQMMAELEVQLKSRFV